MFRLQRWLSPQLGMVSWAQRYHHKSAIASRPDVMQADLIGVGRERRKDSKRRQKLHATWEQQRDEAEMSGVVAAMRSGWKRNRRHGLDGEDVRFPFSYSLPVSRSSNPRSRQAKGFSYQCHGFSLVFIKLPAWKYTFMQSWCNCGSLSLHKSTFSCCCVCRQQIDTVCTKPSTRCGRRLLSRAVYIRS